jgi:hypothetical protein
MCKGIGSDYAGVFPYSWGSVASDLGTQKAYIERGYETGIEAGIDLLALPCIGFNKIGWYHAANYPLIENDDMNDKKFIIHSTSNPTVKLLGYRI